MPPLKLCPLLIEQGTSQFCLPVHAAECRYGIAFTEPVIQQLLAELHLITLFPNLHVPPANALRAKENGC